MATKEELHVGDYGVTVELTIRKTHDNSVLDVSAATIKSILFRQPDGTIYEHEASFVTDGKDGRIKYTTVDGDLDQAGELEYRAMVTLATAHYESSTQRITVHSRWVS